LGRRASARRLVFLVALPVVALLLAALWPYYPVLGLLRVFARPELRGPLAGVAGGTAAPLSATGPTMPFLPAISTFGPALVGVIGLVSLARHGRPSLPIWFALDLALAYLRPLPLHQRFLFFAAMPLMLGAAAVLARAWGAGPLGRAAAVVLLGIGAVSVAQRVHWLLGQEVPDLAFVEATTPRSAVILSDTYTSNGVAGLTGRKVVAPENPDLFLVLSGGWQRVADVRRFLKGSTSAAVREEILRRWQPTHVLIDCLAFPDAPRLVLTVVAEHGGYVLYQVPIPPPVAN